MGGLVSSLAFPVPKLPQSFYHDLLKRRDLVWLETKRGERIPAIHIQAPLRRRRNVTLLFSHGNAEDIALHLPFVTALAHRTGADVLSYEYVGYGPSRFKDCVPSEKGCYRAIDAAWPPLSSRTMPSESVANCFFRPSPPFAVIGSNERIELKEPGLPEIQLAPGSLVNGRSYPWGDACIEDPRHCDVGRLRRVIVTEFVDLQRATHDLYQDFRGSELGNLKRIKTSARNKVLSFVGFIVVHVLLTVLPFFYPRAVAYTAGIIFLLLLILPSRESPPTAACASSAGR